MKTILKMYKHLDWANKRILTYLQSTQTESESVIRLFSHILLAEQIWYTRIMGEDSSCLHVWGDEDLDTCLVLVKENEARFSALLNDLSDDDLQREISYTNTHGKQFVNTIGDILTHVALHGQHHRGQINQRLRADDLDPVGIDYISMVR
ncbi:DinB family protein [Neobacillus sp. PS3-12]|uniref:DinB family protein n=1 Tax=Neobacillus sp. PS3-12 TaxID=3070677 RepID=UPI0027E01CDB|nr:DinB family protein [Neobacillus sp. PS3-12]WML53080.1 DinB family protein [Neobacillus sp. PS3-12]